MLDLIIGLFPVFFLIIGIIFASKSVRSAIILHLIGIVATIAVVFIGPTYNYGPLQVNSLTYFVYAITFLNGFIVLSVLQKRPMEIKQKSLFVLIYQIIELLIILIFITENIIIIACSFFAETMLFYTLSISGHYPKDRKRLNYSQTLLLIGGVAFIALILILVMVTGSSSISEISAQIRVEDYYLKLIIFTLSVCAFLLPIILFPAIRTESIVWVESNHYISHSKSMLQSPAQMLLLFKLLNELKIFEYSNLNIENVNRGIALSLLGVLGVIVGVIYAISELFGVLKEKSRNFKKINGALSFSFFNVIVILYGQIPYIQDQTLMRNWGIGIVILIMMWLIINQLLYAATIINLDDRSINNVAVARFEKPKINSAWVYIFIAALVLTPGLIGYIGLVNLGEVLLNVSFSMDIAILTVNVGFISLIAIFILFLLIMVAYDGLVFYKIKHKIGEFNYIVENYSDYIPIFVTIGILVFATVSYYLSNMTVNEYLTNLIGSLFI